MTCLLALILFFPLISAGEKQSLIESIIFSTIISSGVFCVEFKKKTRKLLFLTGLVTLIMIWTEYFFPNDNARGILSLFIIFFMFYITFAMIWHIAKSEKVTAITIISAINGYLFLGIIGALLLRISDIINHSILNLDINAIQFSGGTDAGFHDFLYFSFVTLTTLGYGDITPVSSLAKSITLIVGISGQLYLTILVAMLVGKFLGASQK